MFGNKWTTRAGIPVLGLTAALALGACDSSERVDEARDTAEESTSTSDIPQYSTDNGTPNAGETGTETPEAGASGSEDQVAEGLDSPTYLGGRSINTADGEPLGEVTQVVVDDAQNVFAVIELSDAETTPESAGTVVVDVDDIDREQNTLMLMSQTTNLKPYEPGNYKPLGQRTEP